jgi:hypothetical protein
MGIVIAAKKVSYILFLIITTLLFYSCATAPKPTMHLDSIPLAEERYPINCALITNNSVGASDIKLLEWKINADLVPRKNLSSVIFDYSQHVLEGLCSTTVKIANPDTVDFLENVDFLVQPKVVNTIAKCDGISMFANCSFSIDLALFFLDNKKIPILEFSQNGHSASKMGSGISYIKIAEQRSYDAITDCFIGLSKKLKSDEMFRFVANNKEFFGLDEATKAREVEKLLSDRNDNKINSLLISYASEVKKVNLLRRILELGVSPDISYGIDGLYPMHRAAYNNNHEMVNLLIEHGANLGQKDERGRTALHFAAWNNYDEITKMLLYKGVDYKNVDEESNLFLSATIYENFGDHFIDVKNKNDALLCYEKSKSLYSSAELYFNDIYHKAQKDIFWAKFKEIMIPAISQFAASYQAQYQAERMAEISALKNRGKGIGYGSASYISYLNIDTKEYGDAREEAEKYSMECKTKVSSLDDKIRVLRSEFGSETAK